MERTVKLRIKVDYNTFSALKEVVEEYREILEDAVNYGFTHNTTSIAKLHAGIYRIEKEKHPGLPATYICTAYRDASMRLKSFRRLKKQGRAYTDKPVIRNITVHLHPDLWKFSLDKISIATKKGRVHIYPVFHKLFWRYYNTGWRIASEARFRLLKGNIVEFYIIFKKDEPEPYKPEGFMPVDLNENSVSILVDGKPVLLETNIKKITLGYAYRRKRIEKGNSTKTREVRRKLKKLKERGRKLDIRRKLAKLIVLTALERRSAIILEDLPKRTPEHMVKDIGDPQLRLRIYMSAFSSMKKLIIEKAREHGVPVILVNPSHTSTTCPLHNSKITYQSNGSNAPRIGRCVKGGEYWHRDVVALYNLKKKAGDVSPMPLGLKEPHDPPTLETGRWMRTKTLHSIIMQGQT